MREKWFAVAPYASSQGGARLNVKVAARTIPREKSEVGQSSVGSSHSTAHWTSALSRAPKNGQNSAPCFLRCKPYSWIHFCVD